MIESEAVDYQRVRVDGVCIRVGIFHPEGDGLPLLLFNGIGASMELLEPFVSEMRNTTVIGTDKLTRVLGLALHKVGYITNN